MRNDIYVLKNLLVECLDIIDTNFINPITGKNENSLIIKEILQDDEIANKFYDLICDELREIIKEKYGI